MIELRTEEGWRRLSDKQSAIYASRIEVEYLRPSTSKTDTAWDCGKDKWQRYLLALAGENEVDPFLNYLDQLDAWDGIDRCESFPAQIWPNLQTNPFAQWFGRYLFLAPILRASRPGCDLREIPVLIGNQRCGKGALARWLAVKREWFTDSVRLDAPRKENDESTQCVVIAELSEMTTNRRLDINRMKSFLTAHTDGQDRAAYGHFTDPYPRRWVPIGTANNTGHGVLPNDPSGNTRFVALSVGDSNPEMVRLLTGDIVSGVTKESRHLRRQLYAEALYKHRHPDEFPAWQSHALPEGLRTQQDETNLDFTDIDELLEPNLDDLLGKEPLGAVFKFDTLLDKLRTAYNDKPLPSRYAIQSALHRRGYTAARRSLEGRQVRCWALDTPTSEPATVPALDYNPDEEPF